MNDERRDTDRRTGGNFPLAVGLVASALLHLLLVVLNPGFDEPSYGRAGGTPAAPGAQFTVLSLSPRDEEELIRLESLPPAATSSPTRVGRPGAAVGPGDGRGAGPETGTDATVAERLRASARTFSPPIALPGETANQRAIRETRERVLREHDELGPLAPNGVARSRGGGSGGGISIPFGFKPPPPAQTVPPPALPDSILRQDSIRAAARAEFRRDSLRAARDTTRWRNVAPRRPVVMPRVKPDTTS